MWERLSIGKSEGVTSDSHVSHEAATSLAEGGENALKNWERWKKARDRMCERLWKRTLRRPEQQLINQGDHCWRVNRERTLIVEAARIKESKCICEKARCPVFWTTVAKETGVRGLEFTKPFVTEHQNRRLICDSFAEYFGSPRDPSSGCVSEVAGLRSSLGRFEESPYLKQRQEELKEELESIEPFRPDIDDLVVVGHSFARVRRMEVTRISDLPTINVEDLSPGDSACYPEQERVPILRIGPRSIRGDSGEALTCHVEFCPADMPYTHARELTMTNEGPITIQYRWEKEEVTEYNLPVVYTRKLLSKFYFNKSDGLLLPGQSIEMSFMFKSNIPGIFREIWFLKTIPELPKIKFQFEAIAFMRQEEKCDFPVDKYLDKKIATTVAKELAEEVKPRSDGLVPVHKAPLLTVRLMFEAENPFLHFDMDLVREAKDLWAKYSTEEWTYSMEDMLNLLLEKIEDEGPQQRLETMEAYRSLFHRMAKMPHDDGISEQEWEKMKYDLCYGMLAAAVGEMEAVLRHANLGIPPATVGPGVPGEYSGEVWELEKIPDAKKPRPPRPLIIEEGEEMKSFTDEEEDKLARLEKVKRVVSQIVHHTALTVGWRVKLDEVTRITAESRWPPVFPYVLVERPRERRRGKEKDKELGELPSRRLKEPKAPPSAKELQLFHRAFIGLHWRNIIERAVDNFTEVVDTIDYFRKEAPL